MHIQITGKQLETGDALRAHVEARLLSVVEKYYGSGAEANVVFTREGHQFATDCAVHLGRDVYMQAQHQDPDIYASFEGAMTKLEKQLRRHKRKVKGHKG